MQRDCDENIHHCIVQRRTINFKVFVKNPSAFYINSILDEIIFLLMIINLVVYKKIWNIKKTLPLNNQNCIMFC